MARISIDENLHMVFYRNLMQAAFELAPDDAMCAVRDEVVNFTMPGAGMTNWARNSVTMAKAGIYDLRLHHDDVVMPVLRFWRVFDRTDLGPAGEQAREELAAFLADLDQRATRFIAVARAGPRARAANDLPDCGHSAAIRPDREEDRHAQHATHRPLA